MSISFFFMVILTILSGGFAIYLYFSPQRHTSMRLLASTQSGSYQSKFLHGNSVISSPSIDKSTSLPDLQLFEEKEISSKPTVDERLFRAGLLTNEQKKTYSLIKSLSPFVFLIVGCLLGSLINIKFIVLGSIVGFLIGLQLPNSYIDRKIAARNDEIMYFLPLVVEQLVLGVSSSLEIGPCIQRVVSMADERDSHNVVTELLKHVHQLILAGSTLDEALLDIGNLSGHTELKHAFISLSQVSRHGGEITRQLQELADAVSAQRETKIEAKIKKLELEATGPVALVFVSFMAVLLVGIGLQISNALQ